MPCDYKQYPDNWKWLSRQIVADAGNKCELCHAPNGAFIQRIKGAEYPWHKIENTKPEDKFTKVVLTVHHINHDKKDSTKQNLICLCQKCHCRLDLAHHMKKSKQTRFSKKALHQPPTASKGAEVLHQVIIWHKSGAGTTITSDDFAYIDVDNKTIWTVDADC